MGHRAVNKRYRDILAAEIERRRQLQSTDDFFAAIEIGFRIGKRPCRKCGNARHLNEIAAYGDQCETCWALQFKGRPGERVHVITQKDYA